MNNLRQNAYPNVNIVGRGKTVGKAKVVFTIGRIHEEPFPSRHQYPMLECQTLYVECSLDKIDQHYEIHHV